MFHELLCVGTALQLQLLSNGDDELREMDITVGLDIRCSQRKAESSVGSRFEDRFLPSSTTYIVYMYIMYSPVPTNVPHPGTTHPIAEMQVFFPKLSSPEPLHDLVSRS
jgi:hypothetical protein